MVDGSLPPRAGQGGVEHNGLLRFLGLPENEQTLFTNEWALYLKNLGRLDGAALCHARVIQVFLGKEDWKQASRGWLNLADVQLLGGRLTAALQAAEEALRLAERADDAEERQKSHACRGYARGLLGKIHGALADFRNALHWQHEAEGITDRSLYGLNGIQHSLLLTRLGRHDEAVRLTQANKEVLRAAFGTSHSIPKCDLVLADLARERGDLAGARDLLVQALDWAMARDQKEVLCWAALVRARIQLSAFRQQQSAHSEERGVAKPLAQAIALVDEGLRIARDCGFGIFHIDLLLVRARLHLLKDDPRAAQADAYMALSDGVTPQPDSGRPALLAATHPECSYSWGKAEASRLLAETLLLQYTGLRDSAKELNLPGIGDSLGSLKGDACADDRLTRVAASPIVHPEGREAIPSRHRRATRLANRSVFLAYCAVDTAGASKLREALLAGGVQVWWDQDTAPGQDRKYAARQAMKQSYAVVLCLSRQSAAQAVNGIYPDALETIELYREYSSDRTLLIPVRLSDCEVPPLEISYTRTLDRLGPVDLFPPSKRDTSLRRLIRSLRSAREQPTQSDGQQQRIQAPWASDTEPALQQSPRGVAAKHPPVPASGPSGPERPSKENVLSTEDGSDDVGKKHVFLSYCHDNTAEVGQLRDDLIAAGEPVWWDQDILPGEDWKLCIGQAMDNSYAVVWCLSKETEARVKSGIYPEALDAIGTLREYAPGSIFLIPVRFSKCEIPPIEIDATRDVKRLQYVDLFPPAKRSAGLQRLIQALRKAPEHP